MTRLAPKPERPRLILSRALAGDPVPATEVGRRAREHGLTAKAIRAAREALGIKIARDGFGSGSKSLWSLPRGHIDAQPIPSEEGRPKTKTKDGYEIIGLADIPCDYCGERAGPPGPQSGPVYLVSNPFQGGKFAGAIIPAAEALHEDCAAFWFDWLRKTGHGKV
jgi:hypothetical protein